MKRYVPVDCNLYDVYIRYIIEKRKVLVTDKRDFSIKTECLLKDIYTKKGIEYISLDNGEERRLDQIAIEVIS